MESPVTRNKTLAHLVREFCAIPGNSAFRDIRPILLGNLLAPAAAVARWVTVFHPQLLKRPALHLVVMGSGFLDSMDDGRWYGLLPWLMGNEDMKVNVTLVGPELFQCPRTGEYLGETETTEAHSRAKLFWPMADLVPTRIDAYLRCAVGRGPIDLFFALNPGFEEEGAWLEPGNLDEVCRRGVPVGIASYCEQERVTEVEILETMGFSIGSKHATNPLASTETPVGQWASSFWEILPGPPLASFVPERSRVERLARFFEGSQHFGEEFGRPPLHEAGTAELLQLPGERKARRMAHLLTPFCGVDLGTGQLIEFDYKGENGKATRMKLPAALLAAFPTGPYTFENLYWAQEAYAHARTKLHAAASRRRERPELALEADMLEEVRSLFETLNDGERAQRFLQVLDEDADGDDYGDNDYEGAHRPWHFMLSTLDWDLTELDDEPGWLEPAFEAHSESGVSLPVICEPYCHVPGDDPDEQVLEAQEILEERFPDGAVLLFNTMPRTKVAGRYYAFGGLLYLEGAWKPFALCLAMRGLDALLEQRRAGFCFEAPDPRYAEEDGMALTMNGLTRGFSGRGRTATRDERCLEWVAEVPV